MLFGVSPARTIIKISQPHSQLLELFAKSANREMHKIDHEPVQYIKIFTGERARDNHRSCKIKNGMAKLRRFPRPHRQQQIREINHQLFH